MIRSSVSGSEIVKVAPPLGFVSRRHEAWARTRKRPAESMARLRAFPQSSRSDAR